GRRQREVGSVDAGDDAVEGDGEVDRREAGRIGIHAIARGDERRGLVDRVDLTGDEVAVAGAYAAERCRGAVDDRVVIGDVEADRPVARAGVDGDGPGRAAAGDVGNAR